MVSLCEAVRVSTAPLSITLTCGRCAAACAGSVTGVSPVSYTHLDVYKRQGITAPVDKDSIRAFNIEKNKLLLANNMQGLGPDILTTIRVNMDSIRKVHPKARLDSINNGADDDGSGTVSILELAEAFSKAKAAGNGPRRSILFMTVTGEEKGLWGSEYYTSNPVIPLANTVCDLNIDMIGRCLLYTSRCV